MSGMDKIELRALVTDIGGRIPYYRVPITEKRLSALSGRVLFIADNVVFDSPIEREKIQNLLVPNDSGGNHDQMIAIFNETMAGHNIAGWLGGVSGSHRLVKIGSQGVNVVTNVTAGQLEWDKDPADAVGYLRNTGSLTDNGMGQWIVGGPSKNIVQLSPIPYAGMRSLAGLRTYLPLTWVETVEGVWRSIQWSSMFNADGLMYVYMTTPSMDSPMGVDAKPSQLYQNELIRELQVSPADEESDSPLARYNPRIGTTTIGTYILDKTQVLGFMRDLWDTTLAESIREQVFGANAGNAILGLQFFYGLKKTATPSTQNAYIQIGNVTSRETGSVKVSLDEFVMFDCGSIIVPRKHGNHLDYTAAEYKVYLPFIGDVDLNPQDVVGKTLYLKYYVNLTDGTALCQLSTTSDTQDSRGLLFSTTCQWGYDIPIRVDPSRTPLLAALRTMTGGLIFQGDSPSYTAGALTGNANVMGDFVPKLFVYQRDELSGDLKTAQGLPSGETKKMGDLTGYVKVASVMNAAATGVPARRIGDISLLLQEGVYI